MKPLEMQPTYDQRLFWIEQFLDSSFKHLDKIHGKPGTNAHLISTKRHNLKTIESFKKEAQKKISDLQTEIQRLHIINKSLEGADIQTIKNSRKLNVNEKEALRQESITNLKRKSPHLF